MSTLSMLAKIAAGLLVSLTTDISIGTSHSVPRAGGRLYLHQCHSSFQPLATAGQELSFEDLAAKKHQVCAKSSLQVPPGATIGHWCADLDFESNTEPAIQREKCDGTSNCFSSAAEGPTSAGRKPSTGAEDKWTRSESQIRHA